LAIEDFTDAAWVETDPNATIWIPAANKIQLTNSLETDTGNVQKDFTAGFFDDFEHLYSAEMEAQAAPVSLFIPWAVTKTAGANTQVNMNALSDGLAHCIYNSGGAYNRLFEFFVSNDLDNVTLAYATEYWYKFARTGTAATLKIYSDSARTVLVDTLAVTTTTDACRYACFATYGTGAGAGWTTGYVKDVDVQQAAASSGTTTYGKLRGVSHWG
jgi:hypothetical protein